jgi:hypothetical protein
MAEERAGRKGKRYVGVDLPVEDYLELERLAQETDSSIGRLVRMGVKMLLRTQGKRDDPSHSDVLNLGLVQKSTGTPDEGAHGVKLNKTVHPAHHLRVNVAPNPRLPIAAKKFEDDPEENN